jgi:glutathione-regulated potassium-efflux system ancillary protein KefC
MGATPLILAAVERKATRRAQAQREDDAIDDEHAPVIIAGFGRYGQIVGRLLFAHGVPATVIDHDPEQVDLSRKLDFKVYYGDATRLDLLEAAGADRARVLVIAIDGVEDSLELVDRARARFPALTLVARARNVTHELELTHRGVHLVQRETFESALRSGRSVLEALGVDPYEARELADAFRRHNLATLRAMLRHVGDRTRLLDISRSGRQELEENLRRDRQARAARGPGGWSGG